MRPACLRYGFAHSGLLRGRFMRSEVDTQSGCAQAAGGLNFDLIVSKGAPLFRSECEAGRKFYKFSADRLAQSVKLRTYNHSR